MATQRRLLMVGDSKLISYANLAAMDGDGVSVNVPAPSIGGTGGANGNGGKTQGPAADTRTATQNATISSDYD